MFHYTQAAIDRMVITLVVLLVLYLLGHIASELRAIAYNTGRTS